MPRTARTSPKCPLENTIDITECKSLQHSRLRPLVLMLYGYRDYAAYLLVEQPQHLSSPTGAPRTNDKSGPQRSASRKLRLWTVETNDKYSFRLAIGGKFCSERDFHLVLCVFRFHLCHISSSCSTLFHKPRISSSQARLEIQTLNGHLNGH